MVRFDRGRYNVMVLRKQSSITKHKQNQKNSFLSPTFVAFYLIAYTIVSVIRYVEL